MINTSIWDWTTFCNNLVVSIRSSNFIKIGKSTFCVWVRKYATVWVNYNLKSYYCSISMENSHKTIIRILLHILKESSSFSFLEYVISVYLVAATSPKFNDSWLKCFVLVFNHKIIKTMHGQHFLPKCF